MAPEYIIVPIEVAHRDFLPVEQEARGRKPEKGEKGKVSLEKAERIMDKKNFIGPDALKKIYGIEPKDVPSISFSEPELREAKERGEFLILRLDTLPNGKPTTMQNLNEYFASDFKSRSFQFFDLFFDDFINQVKVGGNAFCPVANIVFCDGGIRFAHNAAVKLPHLLDEDVIDNGNNGRNTVFRFFYR